MMIELVTWKWVIDGISDSSEDALFNVPKDWLIKNFNVKHIDQVNHEMGYEVLQEAKKDNVVENLRVAPYSELSY